MKLKLALVSAFPPGRHSLNEYGLHLAREMAARTDVSEVVVLADQLTEEAPELVLGPKVRVVRCWSFNSVTAGVSILTALKREGVDAAIWNVQTATFGDREAPAALGLMAPAVARLLGTPGGVIAHNILAGIDLDSTQLKGQRIRQAVVRAAGPVVTRAMLAATYTTVTLRSYADHLGAAFPKAEVHLVPHGTFDTDKRDMARIESRARRIVTMGKFGTYKRLETLLAAFDMLRKDPAFANYELVIGGSDHPNAKGYMASVEAARADDPGVNFHGYVAEDDVPAFFGNARVSVFDYSATTGSSGVLHQTACYGAVPVFPAIGDFVDVCRDEGLAGANYAPENASEMAGAMRRILGDPTEANRLAKANKEASMELPLSKVVEFHVDRLRRAIRPRVRQVPQTV
ncbi:glycosyltransferase [Aliiroseovarius sp. Z3]|uniref:glycosyltransferase n=1 Tax=Aliiroseovarius sp. Z3 TaxID=2811402 RepID=UPI0023B30225|nr:glycosyltransferase [Aliiroseovarius sp. Z3]MDE9450236.1 glycosyltransferase [Aliiroseovarius sp. Z3]